VHTPDVGELAQAMTRLADPELRRDLGEGARAVREQERGWARTVEGIGKLVEGREGELD